MPFVTLLFRLLAMIWALPYTLLGLIVGVGGLCSGGRVRVHGCVIEFHGGGVRWLLERFFHGEGAMALTLGHTILGQTAAALEIARDHELVHVRQFERWGPLMGPAYLGCSLALWLAGRRPYRDNPFERQAYGQERRRCETILVSARASTSCDSSPVTLALGAQKTHPSAPDPDDHGADFSHPLPR